jgi:hypothetical protein
MRWKIRDARVLERYDNVIRVDFDRGPDEPAPRFPGAARLRLPADDVETATAESLMVSRGWAVKVCRPSV